VQTNSSTKKKDEILSSPFEGACEKLSENIYHAIVNNETNLSSQLKEALLLEEEVVTENHIDLNNEENPFTVAKSAEGYVLNDEQPPLFKGLSHRPYYRELSRRILLLTRWHYKYGFDKEDDEIDPTRRTLRKEQDGDKYNMVCLRSRPYLTSAKELGLSESESLPSIYLLPSDREQSPSSCAMWLRSIRDDGVMEIMGMRRTTGTKPHCFPPPISKLYQAAQEPHKNTTLTLAARARSKHAHRGAKDQFFGEAKGSTKTLNNAAHAIVSTMIRDAVWINIHTYGGIKYHVLEIRLANGYGARWSADWDENPLNPTDIKFRGFLEPQMEDGFEKRWRH